MSLSDSLGSSRSSVSLSVRLTMISIYLSFMKKQLHLFGSIESLKTYIKPTLNLNRQEEPTIFRFVLRQ